MVKSVLSLQAGRTGNMAFTPGGHAKGVHGTNTLHRKTVAGVTGNVTLLGGVEHKHGGKEARSAGSSDSSAHSEARIAPVVITGATAANPCVLTAAHTSETKIGQPIEIKGVRGMTELNARSFDITALAAGTVTINVDSTGFTAYGSLGEYRVLRRHDTGAEPFFPGD